MSPVEVLKRVLPFLAGLAIGILPVYISSACESRVQSGTIDFATVPGPNLEPVVVKSRTSCWASKAQKGNASSGIELLAKPNPRYTEIARNERTQGSVVLRVTFLASGEIGEVTPVKELPNGLTEAAVAAARKIEFLPAVEDGRPMTVTKSVEYSFSLVE